MVKSRVSSSEDEDYYPNKKEKEEGERVKKVRRRIYRYKPRNRRVKIESFREIKRRLRRIDLLIDRRINETNDPLVKNFCVSTDYLGSDFVKNALIGNIKWNNVLDRNKLKIKKQREKIGMQPSFEPGYLFDDDAINKFEIHIDDNNELDDYLDDLDENSIDNNQFLSREIRPSFKNKSTDSINKLFKRDCDITNLNRILRYINNSKKSFDNNFENKSNLFKDKFEIKTNQELNQELDQLLKSTYQPIKCFMCSYTTTSIQHLILHSSSHHNYCDLCKMSFKSIFAYFRHIGFHLKETKLDCLFKLEFKCTCCSIVFKQDHHLEEHFNSQHTFIDQRTVYGEQTIRFKCKICNQIDISLNSLKDHFNANHLQVKCPFKNCELWLKNLDQLEIHAFNEHRSFIDNHECEFCSKIFAFKESYDNHLKLKHSILIIDNDRYCLFCNQLLNEQNFDLIIEHLANHTNIYLYNCDICDFRTNSKLEMISHSMKINLNDNQNGNQNNNENDNQNSSQNDENLFLGNCINLNVLWTELSKINRIVHEDLIIKDQLSEAIATIL